MIKILSSSLDTLAILNNVISPIILEELNREFAFSFQTVIDHDKSDNVTYQNIAEIEENYFNIVYTKDNHNADDTLTIDVECEHVSYDLLGDENDPDDVLSIAYGRITPVLAGAIRDLDSLAASERATMQARIEELEVEVAALKGLNK